MSGGGPSTTADCEQTLHIACYNPAQLQRAYGLKPYQVSGPAAHCGEKGLDVEQCGYGLVVGVTEDRTM